MLSWPVGVKSYSLGLVAVDGGGLFSFNISSEPISKSVSDSVSTECWSIQHLHTINSNVLNHFQQSVVHSVETFSFFLTYNNSVIVVELSLCRNKYIFSYFKIFNKQL